MKFFGWDARTSHFNHEYNAGTSCRWFKLVTASAHSSDPIFKLTDGFKVGGALAVPLSLPIKDAQCGGKAPWPWIWVEGGGFSVEEG